MNGEHASHAFPEEWLVQTYQEVARWTVVSEKEQANVFIPSFLKTRVKIYPPHPPT